MTRTLGLERLQRIKLLAVIQPLLTDKNRMDFNILEDIWKNSLSSSIKQQVHRFQLKIQMLKLLSLKG